MEIVLFMIYDFALFITYIFVAPAILLKVSNNYEMRQPKP